MTEDGPPAPIEDTLRRHFSTESASLLELLQEQHKHTDTNNVPDAREPPINWQEDSAWPQREALSFTRSLVFYGTGSITHEHERATQMIQTARALRIKYFGEDGCSFGLANDTNSLNHDHDDILSFQMGKDGVVQLFGKARSSDVPNNMFRVPSIEEFCNDYNELVRICQDGSVRSFCFQRLQMLSTSFKMHTTINSAVEDEEKSSILGTDFYRTMKVDNHIHLAAAAPAKMFVNFVRDKLHNEADTVVLENGQTLKQVFETANLDEDHLTIDAFNVLADYSVYQRFDNFNSKYSPFRVAEMRKIFLKVENFIEGRYFAELTKQILSRHEKSKGHNSVTEMRLSIYGMEREEWEHLAKWVLREWEGDIPGPVLSTHNRWIIQIPRLWRIYVRKGGKRCFQDMIDNIFVPIFNATLYPEDHPEIAEFLNHVVAFDSVDDEGEPETGCNGTKPNCWESSSNPAYSWQLYYIWANMSALNALRKQKGLSTLAFRPHAGETGDVMHLAASYMLCESINHGVNLEQQVSLQYLYYLDQVGLSMSPLSNNFLFRKIKDNPFPKFFRRGLNVTLSTDDPLLFHMSDDALLEEYSVARASFDLSMTDLSEVARNSILQSGFEDEFKRTWLGPDYKKGVTYCDENRTHVPLIRAKYRAEHLAIEKMFVSLVAAGKGKQFLHEMMSSFSKSRNAHRSILVENSMEVPFNL